MPKKNERVHFERARITISHSARRSHFHNSFELYYLLEGECQYHIGKSKLTLRPHELLLVPPGLPHKTTYENLTFHRILLNFPPEYMNMGRLPALSAYFPYHAFLADEEDAAALEEIFARIEAECRRQDAYTKELLMGYLNEIFSLVLRHAGKVKAVSRTERSLVIEDAMAHIAEHYATELSLAEMARRFLMSESRFSRLFKAETGFGFKEYLTSVRIKEANRYLSATSLSVSEVAEACGFHDSNYFSTVFRRVHGVSPLAFRKKHTKEALADWMY